MNDFELREIDIAISVYMTRFQQCVKGPYVVLSNKLCLYAPSVHRIWRVILHTTVKVFYIVFMIYFEI